MKRAVHLFAFVLAVGALASIAIVLSLRQPEGEAQATTGATLQFSPASSSLKLAATPVSTVDVTIAQASGVAGYDAWVSASGGAVSLTALTDSGFLGNPNAQGTPQNEVVCGTPTVTATYGHLACSILALPSPFPAPVLLSAGTAPVALVHASVAPVSAGTSQLALTAVAAGTPETTLLLDVNATPIPASLGGGTITVGATAASVGGVAAVPNIAALPRRPAARAPWLPATVGVAAVILLLAAATAWRRR